MSAQEDFRQLLKKAGYSLTRPRLMVFNALLGHEPLNIRDLAAKTQGIDRASVYRTVALFEQLGIAQRLNIGWKYKLELTDKFAEHHHHLSCSRCGRTIAMNESELEALITRLAAHHQFAPVSHQIEIQGLCQDCQKLR